MIRRFVGYSVFGTLAFGFDLFLLYTLVSLAVPYVVAVPVAFLISTSGHYLGVRSTVFHDSTQNLSQGYVLFLSIMCMNALLVTLIVAGLVEYAGVNLYVARTLTAGIVGILSFYLNSKYNFKVL